MDAPSLLEKSEVMQDLISTPAGGGNKTTRDFVKPKANTGPVTSLGSKPASSPEGQPVTSTTSNLSGSTETPVADTWVNTTEIGQQGLSDQLAQSEKTEDYPDLEIYPGGPTISNVIETNRLVLELVENALTEGGEEFRDSFQRLLAERMQNKAKREAAKKSYPSEKLGEIEAPTSSAIMSDLSSMTSVDATLPQETYQSAQPLEVPSQNLQEVPPESIYTNVPTFEPVPA